MSARQTASSKKKILIVAANPAVSAMTGQPIGFWWSELTHPYVTFTEAGYGVEIRSPEGGALRADSYSDPEDSSGYSADDLVSLGFKKSPAHAALIADTKSLDGVRPDDYDAIFIVGGQSPVYTFRGNRKVQALVAAFYEAGRATALVCHATCVLLEVRLSSGELLVKHKTWTGFSDDEERFIDNATGTRVQPFWIESKARELEGTSFVVAGTFQPFAVRDGHLVTGQQQRSARAAAELVIELLEAPARSTGVRTLGTPVTR